MGQRQSTRTLTEAENEILIRVIEGILKEVGTQEAVAQAIGIQQSAVSSLLRGVWSGGTTLARRVGRYVGVPLCELLRWHEEEEAWADDPVPARGDAIAFALRSGVSLRACRIVRKEPVNEDWRAVDWLELIRRRERALKARKP